jgi:hypothetical protein
MPELIDNSSIRETADLSAIGNVSGLPYACCKDRIYEHSLFSKSGDPNSIRTIYPVSLTFLRFASLPKSKPSSSWRCCAAMTFCTSDFNPPAPTGRRSDRDATFSFFRDAAVSNRMCGTE